LELRQGSDSEGAAKVARQTVRTRDPERAYEVIAETYARLRPRISGSSEEFRFSLSTADAGLICADAMRHSMSFRAGVEPLYCLTAGSVVGGTLTIRRGCEEERFGPGDVLLYPYGVGHDVQWDRFDQGLLRMRFAAVADLAAQSTGTDPGRFRFLGMRPISPAMAAHWRSVATFVHRELAGDEPPMLHPLVLAHTENVVAAAALSVFPNTTLTGAHPTPEGQVGPAALRRAVAYIDTNAGKPITLTDIASGVGVGSRALQRTFARHRDTTPMRYLRRVRLENAHRDLQRADPGSGDSVTRIARRWGFGNPGRFATRYQHVYGQPPHQTLRADSASHEESCSE
jgi:AraC-like DNA-binding protein